MNKETRYGYPTKFQITLTTYKQKSNICPQS